MFNFNFYNPTRILFGKNRIEDINLYIPKDFSVLITYGGGSAKKSGLIDKVKLALASRKIYEFGGIEPNPRYETLMKAIEVIHNNKIDFILAVGGGSVIDGTKFISLASYYEGNPTDLLKHGLNPIPTDFVKKTLPFGSVLTLPAAGSEMNSGAVISYENGKFPVMCESLFPKFSVLDPTITYTLPKIQVANGIADAFVHVLEQYLTYPVDAKVQDRMAEGILQTLIEIADKAISEPDNYDARANLVWCATTALNGIIAVGVPQDWTTHMIGHELTALFGIDHGQTLAVILPSVLEVRRKQKHCKLLQYAERVWNADSGNENDKIDFAIQKTREFFESLGLKTRLSQYGIENDKIPLIIKQIESHGLTALSETQDVSPDITKQIIEKSI